jgi:arsenate reductase (thioredoxin)
MSEALFERAAGGVHEARSAGTTPADHVHANVVAVMREEGIDLSDRKPQLLTTDLAQWADIVITMGCGDACPVIPGKRYVDWDLPDPSRLPVERVRETRDDIARRVGLFLESLDRNSS